MRGTRSKIISGAVTLGLLVTMAVAPQATAADSGEHELVSTQSLPGPPAPPDKIPKKSPRVTKRTTQPTLSSALAVAAAPAARPGAPGANPNQKTLVLYDTSNTWGWLGEAYAVQAANLISHGSSYVMHPVQSYQAGELSGYTGAVYIGSSYDEPIPLAFLDDVLTGAKPVTWMGFNIWQLTQRAADFTGRYGWSWSQFDFSVTPTVTYKNTVLERSPLAAPSGLLATTVVDPAKATVLATAKRADGTGLPWAVSSTNLTYITEIPFAYVGPTDRYFAAADLLGQLANPARLARKRALVRLEDVNPDSDPNELRRIVDYLYNQRVPFTIALIPQYVDARGVENNGVPRSLTLAQNPTLVTILRYALLRGGTLLMHGKTHQYSTVDNPYNGVTGDDFEFYRAHVDSSNTVVYDGPVAEDSATWARSRISSGRAMFGAAGLPNPTIFEPPHYAASAVDYTVINQDFGTRYDRGLYFGGWCPNGACGTGTADPAKLHGQYFPYLVRDVYGSVVVPEALGNVEPVPFNNHPARLPADILASARGLTVVQDSVQSFFYHPYLGTSYLRDLVTGVKAMGYQFVSAATVAAG